MATRPVYRGSLLSLTCIRLAREVINDGFGLTERHLVFRTVRFDCRDSFTMCHEGRYHGGGACGP